MNSRPPSINLIPTHPYSALIEVCFTTTIALPTQHKADRIAMSKPNQNFILFEERLKEVLGHSKRELNHDFPVLQSLIRSEGGVMSVKRLLSPRDRFSFGFKRLIDAGYPNYTLESVVLEFADTGIFNQEEIETARWRLDNKSKAKD